jgi:diguanylate cyclase (GGDEF)-like protein
MFLMMARVRSRRRTRGFFINPSRFIAVLWVELFCKGLVSANAKSLSRILVVDDVEDNRALLSRRFVKRGYLVLEADNGYAALDLIAQQDFDLVLLDIMMPGLNGIEVLKRIRGSYSPDTLPVIMVTAKAGNTDIVEALELGANDYITKPIDFSIAFARAQTQLARKQAKQALDNSLRELEEANRRLTIEIAERKRSDARVDHLTYHDGLTQLGNRVHFRKRLERELQLLQRRDGCLAVMLFDLDGFKLINSTLGNVVGDLLLTCVATRLRDCIRDVDAIGRMGSDEFGVMVAVAGPEQADQLADRIAAVIAAPYAVNGQHVTLSSSTGIALAPNDGPDPDLLISNAQLALNRAKSEGRATRCFFETGMNARAQARRALEFDLRRASSAGEFEVFYQPLFHLAEGVVCGCEALLRWRHPERGLISPSEFIPMAEEIGLIVPLGAWVLRQACMEAASWPGGLKLAVNISAVQFRNRALVEAVVAALAESRLPANRLELEITESVLLNDDSDTIGSLLELRRLGVRISLDDFGTGYSSLSYLRKFPFDKIKIDRSFVQDLGSSEGTMVIVSALIDLATGLGMITTAEGVETQAQFDWLQSEDCTEVQGYLVSPALTAADFRSFLGHQTSRVA